MEDPSGPLSQDCVLELTNATGMDIVPSGPPPQLLKVEDRFWIWSTEIGAQLSPSLDLDVKIISVAFEGCEIGADAKQLSYYDKSCNWLYKWECAGDQSENESFMIQPNHIGKELYFTCAAVDDDRTIIRYCKRYTVKAFPRIYERKLRWVGEGSSTKDPEQVVLTIITYNVMSDHHPKPNKAEKNEWACHWSFRRVLLLRQIISSGAQIICLQAVQEKCYEFLKIELHRYGYEGEYQSKTPNEVKADGCATFFLKDTVKNKSRPKTVIYKHHSNKLSDTKLKTNIEDQKSLALILELEWNGISVVVANTHLSSPSWKVVKGIRTNMKNDVRLFQINTLLGELKVFHENGSSIVICGGMNSTPESEAYKLLCNKHVSPHKLKQEVIDDILGNDRHGNGLPLKSVHKCLHDKWELESRETYFKNEEIKFTQASGLAIDYMVFSDDSLSCVQVSEPVEKSEEFLLQYDLPSRHWGSDHVPVIASFIKIPKGTEDLQKTYTMTEAIRNWMHKIR